MKGLAANRFAWSSDVNRPDAEKTLENYVREAAEAGYDAVECIADGLDALAKEHGIAVCGGYVGGPLHLPWEELDAEEKLLGPARQLAELGGDYLNVNCDPKGSWGNRERKTDDELKRQGANLSRLAAEIGPLGLRLCLHNHANSNPLHLDDLRSVTEFADPAVGVCLDTGWALTSEDDPVARARVLGDRLTALHLRNQRGELPVEWLGEGDMDTAAFVNALKKIGYVGWLTVELWHRADVEVTQSLLEDQKRTAALLRELWGEG